MKDTEFFELLNLYLDHEITAADAARLEAEVQRNPARRQIYRQYCQMQKACTMLAKDYQEQAAAVDTKVVAFPDHRTGWSPAWLGAAGLVAAAACIAVVFVSRTAQTSGLTPGASVAAVSLPAQPVVATVAPVVAKEQPRTIPQTVTVPVRRSDLQLVLSPSKLPLMGQTAALAAAPAELDWIQGVKLSPMPTVPTADDLRFEQKSTLQPDRLVYRSRVPLKTDVEMTAFQFQH